MSSISRHRALRRKHFRIRDRARERGADRVRRRHNRMAHTELVRIRRHRRKLHTPKAAVGLKTYDGKPVAAWIVPVLQRARASGVWRGGVNSGYRSIAHQALLYYGAPRNGLIRGVTVAYPGSSNHNFYIYPRGAVDVSDYVGLDRYTDQHGGLQSYIDVSGWRDPVHFSATGH